MLDTAIVGGGLCGVMLARSLRRQGRAVALFEARERLGGRILSVKGVGSSLAMDLGPTWFWPETQPMMQSLVDELGLDSIPQHDDGSLLHLNDADKAPERIDGKMLHAGARRLPGGMAQLIDTLAAGDVFHGAFTLTLAEGRAIVAAMRFAAAAAGLKCTRFGGATGAPRRHEVEALLAGH